MVEDQHSTHKTLNRRKILAGAAAGASLGLTGLGTSPAFARKDPVVTFMNRSAKKLLNAARSGSPKAFLRFILRYTDIGGISMYSLGEYRTRLLKKHQKIYVKGTARHIMRYFTSQSRKYPILKAEIGEKSWQEGDSHFIDTEITLITGASYSVRWQLIQRKNRFKISNVRVLGFWLLGFQRSQFESYISKQGGKVEALVSALHYRK